MATQNGYILIADITGYTRYLHESELDHAQKTLTALLNLLINQTKPPLTISRLAGDAVISYGFQDNFYKGQTFVELIEGTYVAFRRAIDMMVINTTCDCRACRNIGSLDLKFFIHYGAFALQKLDAHAELLGSDVNLIHRLLKNTVTETTGVRAYALYTAAAVEQLGIQDLCEIMQPHKETYEHLGEIDIWVQDLHPVWAALKDSFDVVVPPEDIVFAVETEINQPIEVVWDHLADGYFRAILTGADSQHVSDRKNGRVTEGSKFICYHGEEVTVQTVVHWKPFDHMITHDLIPVPFPDTVVMVDYRLYPTANGTRFVHGFGKIISGSKLARVFVRGMIPGLKKGAGQHIEAFRIAVEANAARPETNAAPALTDEMVITAVKESLAGER